MTDRDPIVPALGGHPFPIDCDCDGGRLRPICMLDGCMKKQIADVSPNRRRVYHGCGHYWMRALVKWDDGYELIEGWHYVRD